MADKLNGSTPPGPGHNSMSSEQFLTFLSELDEAEAEHGSALAACKEPKKKIKDVRKRIKDAGFDLKAFDRAREDATRPASEREREHQQHQMMMAWQRKPIGTQATIFDAPPLTFSVAELKMVDNQGFVAGKSGERADANPHAPMDGNEAAARWHSAWIRGQAAMVEADIKTPDTGKKKVGRPRKAKPTNGTAEPSTSGEPETSGAGEGTVETPLPSSEGETVGHAVLE